MPIMSGTEAADEIRKITNVPMVLLTADITERMRNESIKHGFVEFMQKPIDIALLKQNLEIEPKSMFDIISSLMRKKYISSLRQIRCRMMHTRRLCQSISLSLRNYIKYCLNI